MPEITWSMRASDGPSSAWVRTCLLVSYSLGDVWEMQRRWTYAQQPLQIPWTTTCQSTDYAMLPCTLNVDVATSALQRFQILSFARVLPGAPTIPMPCNNSSHVFVRHLLVPYRLTLVTALPGHDRKLWLLGGRASTGLSSAG